MRQRQVVNLVLSLGLCGACSSCVGRDPPSIQSRDPDALVPAIKAAVDKHDTRVIPYLVKDLDSDDPAVRMYAIDGLRRLTGDDLGYVYYASPEERRPAVDRWKTWYRLYVPST
jgi:hypothetical protein